MTFSTSNIVALLAVLQQTVSIESSSSSPWCINPHHPAEIGMYGNLGRSARLLNVSQDLPAAGEALFQQGMAQIFGFNNVEALRNFRTAADLSPNCALCYWGIAVSFSPNINYCIENQTSLNAAASKALSLANAQSHTLSPKTLHLIRSFAQLIAPNDHVDVPTSPYRQQWSNALCGGSNDKDKDKDKDELQLKLDPDVASFCASSLMSLTPWNYYTTVSSWPPNASLKEPLVVAKQMLLDSVHRGAHGHPHAFSIHLLIHLLEPSNAPISFRWEALGPTLLLFNGSSNHGSTIAKNTTTTGPPHELVPSQGHLTHMPAHLFLRVGKYNAAVSTSQISADVDNSRYTSQCLRPYGHGHNLKMYVANARLAGRLQDAVMHARRATLLDAGEEPSPNGGTQCVDCAGSGSPEVVLTLARFAQWESVLAEKVPEEGGWGMPRDREGYHKAAFRYARAAAYWALSNGGKNITLVTLGDAEASLCKNASVEAVSPEGSFNYTVILPQMLLAARAMHAYPSPNYTAAIAHLRLVTRADDDNAYLEPPRVWYPPRECLGSLLLYAPMKEESGGGNATEALETFQEDLVSYVESPWSLFGAARAAKYLGRDELALNYTRRAEIAWSESDQPVPATPCPELLLSRSSGRKL